MALALACSAMAARGEALFETVQALALPRGDHGYRGINGDFAQLKGGAILWSYASEGEGLMAMRSADQGRTWSPGAVHRSRGPRRPRPGGRCTRVP